MFVVTGILIAAIAPFNFNIPNNSHREIANVQNEMAGLAYFRQIARTIEHLHQHRGLGAGYLSGNYLSGNLFLKGAILAEGQQIGVQINAAGVWSARSGFMPESAYGNNWASIKAERQLLKERSNDLSVKESFNWHSSLIGGAVSLLDNISDSFGKSILRPARAMIRKQ